MKTEVDYSQTYWCHKGKHNELSEKLNALVPESGEVPNADDNLALEKGNCSAQAERIQLRACRLGANRDNAKWRENYRQQIVELQSKLDAKRGKKVSK